MLKRWERDGSVIAKCPLLFMLTCKYSQTKVALRCENEEELLLMQAQAQSLNLCARSIQDAYGLLCFICQDFI